MDTSGYIRWLPSAIVARFEIYSFEKQSFEVLHAEADWPEDFGTTEDWTVIIFFHIPPVE